MEYKITSVVGSHVGVFRSNHEDNYLLNGQSFLNEHQVQMIETEKSSFVQQMDQQANRLLCAIADGIGGAQAGEVASLVTVQLLKQSQKTIMTSTSLHEASRHYQAFLNLLNAHVNRLTKMNIVYSEMGSTLTTLLVHGDEATIINLGDSPGFVYTPLAGLTKVTVAQTYGQVLLNRGEILPNQLEEKVNYKYLTRYIGMGQVSGAIEGHISPIIEIEDGKLFLLCSDGLTDHLSNEEIETVIATYYSQQNWKLAVETLIQYALQKGGLDNITVMLVHFATTHVE